MDKLLFLEFTSFMQLCIVLHNYQLQVSQFELFSSMALVDKNESAQQSFVKFKLNKRFIKFNDNKNTQVEVATIGVPPLSKYFRK